MPPNKIDTALLPLALKVIRTENKILNLFNYPDFDFIDCEIEADVLMAMGKKEEAIKALESIIYANSPESLKETLRARIALIKSESH